MFLLEEKLSMCCSDVYDNFLQGQAEWNENIKTMQKPQCAVLSNSAFKLQK